MLLFFRSHQISTKIRVFRIEPKAAWYFSTKSNRLEVKRSRSESIRFKIRSSLIRVLTVILSFHFSFLGDRYRQSTWKLLACFSRYALGTDTQFPRHQTHVRVVKSKMLILRVRGVFGERLGLIVYLVRNISFYLSYTSTAILTLLITYINQRRSCIFF